MSKKLIITLCVIFGFVAVLLILFWTLFGLSSVTVKFSSTRENLTITEQEIVEAGQFRYGACVLFEGKKSSIKKIENMAKENPNFAYLRVVNIETVFPNKFVIHVQEREELFAVSYDEKFLICDRDLRVLDILDNFQSEQDNAILLKNLEIKNQTIEIGDFLQTGQSSIKKLYSAFLESGRDLSAIRGKFKEITLGTCTDEFQKTYDAIELKTFQNRKFVINNIDFALSGKVKKMFSAETSLFMQTTDEDGNITNANGEILYVVKTQNGEYVNFNSVKDLTNEEGEKIYHETDKVALTYSLLANCYIKVDNLTLSKHVNRTEKDIYYAIVAES